MKFIKKCLPFLSILMLVLLQSCLHPGTTKTTATIATKLLSNINKIIKTKENNFLNASKNTDDYSVRAATTKTTKSTSAEIGKQLSLNKTTEILLYGLRSFHFLSSFSNQKNSIGKFIARDSAALYDKSFDVKASHGRNFDDYQFRPKRFSMETTPQNLLNNNNNNNNNNSTARKDNIISNNRSPDSSTTKGPSSGMRKRTSSAEMLSRNISIILENLLKSYEQSQLPTHGQGVPTVVRTNILIRSMGPVSELDMDYSMDCYFRQYWRDKRLSFQGPIKSLSLSIKMLDKIWRPDTYFYNGKHSHIHTITVPNKLLRLDQDGGILYSMRLTIKATCPMELKNFPMDHQSCPLIIGSYGYTSRQLVYQWKSKENAVSFVPGMTLNQFDLISMDHRNRTYARREGEFSVLHVAFNLKRHTGYFLIQVYVPCILIVVLSWVSFWIHREATSDRVGLCITAVLTLSTISLDSRTDLPKVKYATALDWFLLISFLYCIATLLEFAGVHYFTKIGSGEVPLSEDEWEDMGGSEGHEIDEEDAAAGSFSLRESNESICELPQTIAEGFRKRNAMICPNYNDPSQIFQPPSSHASTMERTTQTEPPVISKARQVWLCFIGDEKFRKQRERDAASIKGARPVNSVSLIDRVARIAFPVSFAFFNLLYWLAYGMYKKEFS